MRGRGRTDRESVLSAYRRCPLGLRTMLAMPCGRAEPVSERASALLSRKGGFTRREYDLRRSQILMTLRGWRRERECVARGSKSVPVGRAGGGKKVLGLLEVSDRGHALRGGELRKDPSAAHACTRRTSKTHPSRDLPLCSMSVTNMVHRCDRGSSRGIGAARHDPRRELGAWYPAIPNTNAAVPRCAGEKVLK